MRLCHPDWPDRPASYHVAHPTLVAEQDGALVGYTVFVVAPDMTRGVTIVHGRDHGVHPDHRGKGLGMALHVERCVIGRENEAVDFVGVTWEGNRAMRAIFTRCGYRPYGEAPGAFPGGVAGVVWIGSLG